MGVDTRHGIHITDKAGSYHMSSENWQINLKACQTLRSQSSDAFRSIWSSSVTFQISQLWWSNGANQLLVLLLQRCWFGPDAHHSSTKMST